ncbi:MAG: radical SAM protein [Tistrella sp.]|jgi:MoaA/NifB/PqqE/SkfB family radical SAM enzyme|uniref:Radical SAM protein n=2 Tax=Tistrella mobilis TaxID=171437 RepID=A0A3B9INZ8_9PROT|nr:radical SAM protein [Tistrella sp.]MAD40753.1 radical SAM protein [Tistrella sp.]MBA78774.1 radical SAM protein [Tistrella sp.]HAE48949.1 radical SAM protein [Tistrella mobilis]
MKTDENRNVTRERMQRLEALLDGEDELRDRLQAVLRFSRKIRVSEYHLTNACNIRCKGCWFFEYGHDTATREAKDAEALEAFLIKETKERRVNAALVIGGEPTLFPDRLRLYVKHMPYVTISSNGLRRLPMEGFENVAIGLTLFGGGPMDDQLRGIKPSGRTFSGLFETALGNYRDDPRAGFIYALTETGIEHIEETVVRIRDNGNRVNFNFYSAYDAEDPTALARQEELLEEALRVRAKYPDTVVSTPYYIRTMITGRSHFGRFGYDVCPSLSQDHAGHADRLVNGNPVLPFFNTWAADLKTVKFCCTSGHCNGCRDSQAVISWMVVSMDRFLTDKVMLETWVEMAESYWKQFIWGPFHWTKDAGRRQAVMDPIGDGHAAQVSVDLAHGETLPNPLLAAVAGREAAEAGEVRVRAPEVVA